MKKKLMTLVTIISVFSMNAVAYAADGFTVSIDEGTAGDYATNMGSLIGLIVDLAMWIGAGVLVWGLIKFALALYAHEPSQQVQSYWIIGSGALLLSLKLILGFFGVTVG